MKSPPTPQRTPHPWAGWYRHADVQTVRPEEPVRRDRFVIIGSSGVWVSDGDMVEFLPSFRIELIRLAATGKVCPLYLEEDEEAVRP